MFDERERHTFDAELAFTSTVMFLFLICDWISPSIRSAFFVLVAVIACIEKFKEKVDNRTYIIGTTPLP